MTGPRRVVRALSELFNLIDHRLPAHVRADFLANHLFTIVDEFAEGFDRLSSVPGEDPERCRAFIGSYQSLAYVVAGCLQLDGAIELYDIEFDLSPPWADDELGSPDDLD